jgi:hypothetical protein
MASGIRQGAHGSYSNVACLSPAAGARWYEQIKRKMECGLELERRIQTFMDVHIAPLANCRRYSNQALDKLLAAIGNWADIGTRLRWPYRGVTPAEADRLRPIARQLLPEFIQ